MIVADANLIIYLYVAGPLAAMGKAAWAKDPDWRTAPLWRCELTSAVLKMIRAGVLDEQDAHEAMNNASSEITPREVHASQQRVLRLALQYGISAYDAQYVALAEMLGVPCVTAGAALARKASAFCVPLTDFIK